MPNLSESANNTGGGWDEAFRARAVGGLHQRNSFGGERSCGDGSAPGARVRGMHGNVRGLEPSSEECVERKKLYPAGGPGATSQSDGGTARVAAENIRGRPAGTTGF